MFLEETTSELEYSNGNRKDVHAINCGKVFIKQVVSELRKKNCEII